MHQEARSYVARQVDGRTFTTVVEIGSRYINGQVRDLFAAGRYIGLDSRAGRGVDVVADAADGWRPDEPADCVVCCEVLEHVEDPASVVESAAGMLRPGGTLILTCATDPRAPHSAFDGAAVRDGEHYRNVTKTELRDALDAAGFVEVKIERDGDRGDLYATARLSDDAGDEDAEDDDVEPDGDGD